MLGRRAQLRIQAGLGQHLTGAESATRAQHSSRLGQGTRLVGGQAAERPLGASTDLVGRAAAVLALLVAAWFLVLRDVLARFDVTDPVARWWALALLGPAALLAVRAWRCRGDRSWFGLALGAVAAAGGALWLSELVPDDVPRCSPA